MLIVAVTHSFAAAADSSEFSYCTCDDVGQRSTGFVRCGSKTESMFEEEPGQSAVMILPLTGDLLQSKSLIRHSSVVYIPILAYIILYIYSTI